MIKSQVSQTVTFDQLAQTLVLLGFERHEMPAFTMFRNTEFDAVITLPREDASSTLRPLHLAAARTTIAGKGVATPADFDQLLVQARQPLTHQEKPCVKAKKARRVAA